MRSSRETEPGAEAEARKRLNTDTAAGGIGFAFALAYLAAAFTIPEGSFSNAVVGPAALPTVIGAALAVAVGHLHLYALRPGVEGVFAKLLDHGGWAVDDLPGGDLLRHEGVEYLYLTQEERTSTDGLRG